MALERKNMKKSELRSVIRLLIEQELHSEPEPGPFPAEFHEFMEANDHEFPGPDAHKVLRETLKSIGVEHGLEAAVDYVIEQFPQYKDKRESLTKMLKMDKIDVKVKFEK